MLKLDDTLQSVSGSEGGLAEFWPVQAETYLEKGEYAKVVELCEPNMDKFPTLLSARIIYSRALLKLNKQETATEQLYQALSIDPDNVVALKLLGDLHYQKNDSVLAMANYRRVLEIDPECRGLKCELLEKVLVPVVKLTLQRSSETAENIKTYSVAGPFRTETVADLYLAQGQPRVALEIIHELAVGNPNPRMSAKLTDIERLVAQKERRDV